jgi:hypothetical protein
MRVSVCLRGTGLWAAWPRRGRGGGKGGEKVAYIVSVAGSKEVEHHLGGRGKVLEALEHFCTGGEASRRGSRVAE